VLVAAGCQLVTVVVGMVVVAIAVVEISVVPRTVVVPGSSVTSVKLSIAKVS